MSREHARHGGRETYRALHADARAWQRARRTERCRLARSRRLRRLVASRRGRRWSPSQIAGWLRERFPATPELQLSHETIYRTLYVQARGALKKELLRHLRTHRVTRRARTATRRRQGRGRIVDAVSITWDRGTELAHHKSFTVQTGIPVYFCDPQSP